MSIGSLILTFFIVGTIIIMLTTIGILIVENNHYEEENTALKIALDCEKLKSKLFQDILDEVIREVK